MKFKVIPSNIPEDINRDLSYSENVKKIALEKAKTIAIKLRSGIVIGADTIVVLDHHILGKPNSKNDAKRMLSMLSGREHSVFSGFAIYDVQTGKHVEDFEETKVRFRVLDKKEIDEYVESGSPMDKAGAYGIQDDFGAVFVERINGCYYNVVGFPLSRFYSTYKNFVLKLSKKQ